MTSPMKWVNLLFSSWMNSCFMTSFVILSYFFVSSVLLFFLHHWLSSPWRSRLQEQRTGLRSFRGRPAQTLSLHCLGTKLTLPTRELWTSRYTLLHNETNQREFLYVTKAVYLTRAVLFLKDAQSYADDNSLLFMETSAKTSMNVNEIFMAIGKFLPHSLT